MKVKELIEKLHKLDSGLEVYCYEEGPASIETNNPGPFDIGDVSEAKVEMKRIAGKPVLTFGGDAATRRVAIIGITQDF